MQSPITYNAHLRYCNFPQLVSDAKALNPTTILAYADDGDGVTVDKNHPLYILQRELPNTRIFVRIFDKDDHRFHAANPADGKYVVSPAEYLSRWGFLGKQGRTLQVMNEPSGYGADTTRLASWLEELIPQASKLGVSVAVPAFAVHHPQTYGGEWVAVWDRVLRLLVEHHQFVNLHEYGPEYLYDPRMGRFMTLLRRCATLGIKPPRIFISEWGLDSLPGEAAGNGYKARGYSGKGYLAYLREQYSRHYASYVRNGVIVGLAIFSYGNSGGWEKFDVGTDRDFLNGAPAAFQTADARPLIDIPASTPAPVSPLLTNGWVPGQVKQIPSSSMNVRQQPSINSPIIGTVKLNEAVTVLDGWTPVRLADGTHGYVYEYGGVVVID